VNLLIASALAAPTLLVCDAACEDDLAWVQAVTGETPPLAFTLLEPDQQALTAFDGALDAARKAAARGHWRGTLAAADEAVARLEAWQGPVDGETLAELHFLRGAARLRVTPGASWATSFRTAAAIWGRRPATLPLDDPDTAFAFDEELRQLMLGGTGRLVVTAPAGSRVFVNGRLAGAETELLAARHRITVERPGARVWTAEVPVLAERTTELAPPDAGLDELHELAEALELAFSTLQAPAQVRDLLASLCAAEGVDELRLLQVEVERVVPSFHSLAVGDAPATRPASADGAARAYDELLALTWEDEVLQAEVERRPIEERRLEVIWFDPASGSFRTERASVAALPVDTTRFELGATGGFAQVLGAGHGAADLDLAWLRGAVGVVGDLGLVRGAGDYRLYPDRHSAVLYHGFVGAAWSPERPGSPRVAVGPEAYVPVAWGLRAEASLGLALEERWSLRPGVHAAFGGSGVAAGGGVTLAARL